jgi:hypothetical protein
MDAPARWRRLGILPNLIKKLSWTFHRKWRENRGPGPCSLLSRTIKGMDCVDLIHSWGGSGAAACLVCGTFCETVIHAFSLYGRRAIQIGGLALVDAGPPGEEPDEIGKDILGPIPGCYRLDDGCGG